MATLISPEQAGNIGHAVIDVREFPEYAAGGNQRLGWSRSLRWSARPPNGTRQSRFFLSAAAERELLKQQRLWSALVFKT